MRQYRYLLAVAALAGRAGAQSNLLHPEPIFSMGQPPRSAPYAAALAVAGGGSTVGAALALGIRRPILNPITGLLSWSAEMLGEWKAGDANISGRLLANAPGTGLSAGIDWSMSRLIMDPVFTFETAIRRGGLAGGGSALRLDWLPTRRQTVALGIQMPLAQPFAGRTRPRTTHADIPPPRHVRTRVSEPLSDSIERALRVVARAAPLIRAYNSLWFDEDREALAQDGRSYQTVNSAYLEALSTAFGLASGLGAGGAESIARAARASMLGHVILRYDALFGQSKHPPRIDGLLDDAHDHFTQWMADSSGVPPPGRARVMAVFDRWAVIVGEVQRKLLAEWKDSRFVWIPPVLALAPDEYDEQAEVDGLIGRAVGHPFTDDNAVAYMRTADLPLEIARSIAAARTYHVLRTHDFAGRRDSGDLDDVSYVLATDAYLPALTKAVERFDSTGVMTQFMILLDAYYYHAREGRLWMDLLEHPLAPGLALRDMEWIQAEHVRRRVEELRAAVARSWRLQREAAARGAYGRQWLDAMVRVHVSVVLPSDFAFRNSRIAPPLPFVSDNVIRDHRKVVLYDFTEAAPYDGALLVTGVGIGEHYASVTWEDRGLRVRGPAALEARAALRRALSSNGFLDEQIPPVLRPVSGADAGAARTRSRDVTRALEVDNDAGSGAKGSSVARAMLYSLAPPGSVIIAPDPLWLSETWAAMLAGAAARGSNVSMIAPAFENAPSPEAPVIALERRILRRLLALRRDIAKPSDGNGVLHVGVYAAKASATNIAGRLAEVRSGLNRYPWIHEVIPFDAKTIATLDAAATADARAEAKRPVLARDEEPRRPQLHQKTLFVARPGAIAALLRQPGWDQTLARALRTQAERTTRLADAVREAIPEPDGAASRSTEELLERYERSLSDAERKQLSFFFVIGTQNHDVRGLALDGEASVVLSGFPASAGLVDLFYLMARTTWVESDGEVDQLLPAPGWLLTKLARVLRDVM